MCQGQIVSDVGYLILGCLKTQLLTMTCILILFPHIIYQATWNSSLQPVCAYFPAGEEVLAPDVLPGIQAVIKVFLYGKNAVDTHAVSPQVLAQTRRSQTPI